MHRWLASLAILLLTLPATAAAQGRGGGPAAPRPVAGNGVEVPGWWGRLDNPKEGREGLRVTRSGSGVRVVTGPNAIFFDPTMGGEGHYTVKANFTLNKPASHPVAYGLFFGGNDLDQDDQRYTYFVIRQDGKFLVKKRTGATTANVGADWMDHAAIVKPDASGKQTNELAVRVAKDAVTFLVNGQPVAKHPASAVDTTGIAGLRIGHGLDVQVDSFTAQPDGATPTN